MSRCFPYPPPDYQRSEPPAPPSIQSIKKAQKDANEKRKEKKREKKERKEKQVMPKDEHGKLKHQEHSNKKRKYDDRIEPNKKSKEAPEQLEGSGLTAEHGLPCSVQGPCESSESTQNSSKSKKHESAQNSSKSRKLEAASAVHGCTTLWLKLPLQKCKDPESFSYNQMTTFKVAEATLVTSSRTTSQVPETARASEQSFLSGRTGSQITASKVAEATLVTSSRTTSQVPDTARAIEQSFLSGRTGSQITTSKVAEATLVTSSRTASQVPDAARAIEQSFLSGRTGSQLRELNSAKAEPCFSARATKSSLKAVELGENARIKSSTKSKRHSRAQKLEKRFRDLTVDWKPAPFLFDGDIDDSNQGWLYGNSQTNAKGWGFSNTNLEKGCGTVLSSFQPRAYYLPELEMYQLPYVVPF